MNLFKKGYEMLARDLIKECGENISVYRNGVLLCSFKSTPAITSYENMGSDGKNIFAATTSFSVKISENYIPKQGDIFVNDNGEKFEVRPLKDVAQRFKLVGTNLYRKDDEQGSLIIIHAQRVL